MERDIEVLTFWTIQPPNFLIKVSYFALEFDMRVTPIHRLISNESEG